MRTLIDDIEAFLIGYPHVKPSQIGMGALGDSVFVRDVRAGRAARPKTQARVRQWMADYAKAEEAKAPLREAARREVAGIATIHGGAAAP